MSNDETAAARNDRDVRVGVIRDPVDSIASPVMSAVPPKADERRGSGPKQTSKADRKVETNDIGQGLVGFYQAPSLRLVRAALGLVCRPSRQGNWAVSQGVKRKTPV